MTVMGETSTYDHVTMKIEAVDDATVKVTLPACGEGMMALPALVVPAVKVSGSMVLMHSLRKIMLVLLP